ncbi:MAG: CHAT domain-containing protein [Leptospiraceae bacterium]|nr:CHAT domain-containing protein [Leptospiraceae bacterium]
MINLLIDRVGNVNIFNFLDSNNSVSSESHIHSRIDTDLIQEYIREMENVSKISRSLKIRSSLSDIKPDILKELKSLGETFFDQFFPSVIADKLRQTKELFLHFHIDEGLKDIPWELLYDGNSFLADKFCIGKTVKGRVKKEGSEENKKIKMLIIADPTEDLEWAQREGEELFRTLHEEVPPNLLELHFVAGRQITKLKLLSLIKGKHIIHYAGHLYFSEEPLENGWLLSGGKVLKAREISNSGFSTSLVFSNSCQSSKSTENEIASSSIMSNFAGSFLMSGIQCFVGTNWEVEDNKNTLDFTVRFYLSLFNHKTVGESLYFAREYARRNYEVWDLTWANYTLHGIPNFMIHPSRKETRKKIIDPSLIKKYYPLPIARSYMDYIEKEPQMVGTAESINSLIKSFEQFSKVIGAIILSDYLNQSLGQLKVESKDKMNLAGWWEILFSCMWDFKKIELSMFMETFMEVLSTHREIINKMNKWIDNFDPDNVDNELTQGYLVTFQYYFENLLMELSEFESCSIIYFPENSIHYYTFDGYEPKSFFASHNPEFDHSEVSKYSNNFLMYNRNKKQFLPLLGFNLKEKSGAPIDMIPDNKILEKLVFSE